MQTVVVKHFITFQGSTVRLTITYRSIWYEHAFTWSQLFIRSVCFLRKLIHSVVFPGAGGPRTETF
jgi:hypothetical protein